MKYYLLFILLVVSIVAKADLLISPTSVFIGDRDRVKEVVLINTGNKKNTYRLSMKDMFQGGDGEYRNVNDFAFSAAKFIRFSPRQVSLKPGERQTIKLIIRRNNKLPDGDLRSHLSFTILPTDYTDSELNAAQNNSETKISLRALVSYSIPVVVQIGDPKLQIQLSKLSLGNMPEGNSRTVAVKLEKQGNNGVFGKLELFALDRQGNSQQIGILNNANIFRESTSRNFVVNLNNLVEIKNGSQITVKYTDVGRRKELVMKEARVL